MPSKMSDEITYPFPNFNGCTVKIWEWISIFILHFIIPSLDFNSYYNESGYLRHENPVGRFDKCSDPLPPQAVKWYLLVVSIFVVNALYKHDVCHSGKTKTFNTCCWCDLSWLSILKFLKLYDFLYNLLQHTYLLQVSNSVVIAMYETD